MEASPSKQQWERLKELLFQIERCKSEKKRKKLQEEYDRLLDDTLSNKDNDGN